jgi:hypothetical protein
MIKDSIPQWMLSSENMAEQRDWYMEALCDVEETLNRFTDFVISVDASIYDAFVFVENLRAKGITE